ncbi:MAG: class I SAM-dependent methyltransferase [Corallococcus sp.]|nr:class I SAM-dependent methyltransferase [Corallococcus sp.]MCM1359648.1 class I SAM-dependent methyltransferase [Corallococcus sp.]MCM1395357.1 class I SAM-dependent methyltransferase [Corallococcus sp.]
MQNYSVLAKYYDKFSQNDCDYESWSQYLSGVAERHKVRLIADLACGTGKMTALLCKKGYKLIGVDASFEMLTEASQKCRALFVNQDMLSLSLPHPADMAVVVNDGVNYLKSAQLAPFFDNLSKNLTSGAPLVFDVSSLYKLQTVVGNNVFFVDDEDATLLWSNRLSKESVKMELTLFCREEDSYSDQLYRRFDETHVQYIHTREDLEKVLTISGFDLQEVTADYGKPFSKTALRHTYYATKKH